MSRQTVGKATAKATRPASTKGSRRRKAATDVLSDQEIRTLRAACDRALGGHGIRSSADPFAEIGALSPAELEPDTYGVGGAVAALEDEVRELLGKPAAVFMPSGTMAQQIALRIHADRRGPRVVAFHPTCHLELHEDKAYQRLHGLVGLTVGTARELLTLSDLEAIQEPLAALLIELPQREIGGRLPAWSDLVAQVRYAHDRGAATHLDGARLWESGPFYGRPLAEISALFDTVYVSFYKGLGGPAGSMLLGESEVIAEARAWRHRHGGTLLRLWPYAAAGLAGLRLRLPRMPAYVEHARAIAAELTQVDGEDLGIGLARQIAERDSLLANHQAHCRIADRIREMHRLAGSSRLVLFDRRLQCALRTKRIAQPVREVRVIGTGSRPGWVPLRRRLRLRDEGERRGEPDDTARSALPPAQQQERH
jgi:threonine aldolase